MSFQSQIFGNFVRLNFCVNNNRFRILFKINNRHSYHKYARRISVGISPRYLCCLPSTHRSSPLNIQQRTRGNRTRTDNLKKWKKKKHKILRIWATILWNTNKFEKSKKENYLKTKRALHRSYKTTNFVQISKSPSNSREFVPIDKFTNTHLKLKMSAKRRDTACWSKSLMNSPKVQNLMLPSNLKSTNA